MPNDDGAQRYSEGSWTHFTSHWPLLLCTIMSSLHLGLCWQSSWSIGIVMSIFDYPLSELTNLFRTLKVIEFAASIRITVIHIDLLATNCSECEFHTFSSQTSLHWCAIKIGIILFVQTLYAIRVWKREYTTNLDLPGADGRWYLGSVGHGHHHRAWPVFVVSICSPL